jgi:hypothetical protein
MHGQQFSQVVGDGHYDRSLLSVGSVDTEPTDHEAETLSLVGRILASAERWLSSYISTRMRRGVPGPPGNRRAAITTKSTRATIARSGSAMPIHQVGVRTSIGSQPTFRVFGIKQKCQSSIDSNEHHRPFSVQSLSSVPLQ